MPFFYVCAKVNGVANHKKGQNKENAMPTGQYTEQVLFCETA